MKNNLVVLSVAFASVALAIPTVKSPAGVAPAAKPHDIEFTGYDRIEEWVGTVDEACAMFKKYSMQQNACLVAGVHNLRINALKTAREVTWFATDVCESGAGSYTAEFHRDPNDEYLDRSACYQVAYDFMRQHGVKPPTENGYADLRADEDYTPDEQLSESRARLQRVRDFIKTVK